MRSRRTRALIGMTLVPTLWSCAPSPTPPAASPVQAATPAVMPGGPLPLKHAPQPTTAAITPADLMTRLYIYADDSLEGRRGGTRGDFRATAYIADQVRALGLEPAGENGTYFQNIPLAQRAYDPSASLAVDGRTLTPWVDYLPRDHGPNAHAIDGVPVIFGGVIGPDTSRMLAPAATAGKMVLFTVAPLAGGKAGWSVNRAAVAARYRAAAGIAVLSLDVMPADMQAVLHQPALRFGTPAPDTVSRPTYVYVTEATARAMLGGADPRTAKVGAAGRTVRGRIAFTDGPTEAPARNVVAILRGSDPALRGQYVAIGAHNDHIGLQPPPVDHDSLRAFNTVMRPGGAEDAGGVPTAEQASRIAAILDSLRRLHPARADSIANGADDDGSGTVTVLEIAEWFAMNREHPKRSILFVWHTGEELGLLGSSWYTDHPTVPRDSIVGQLNIDMVGRGGPQDVPNGGPGYLQLIGSRRLSTEMGSLVEAVNLSGAHGFTFDYQYDTNGNPHQYYCRSDHYEYARYGIPITFFTTGGHRDYHQVTDEPQYIDYGHMARVGALIGDIAMHVADLDHRLVVDHPKPDPHGGCRQ